MHTRRAMSFVVRLAPGSDADGLWHGEVEHVQNGRRTRIQSLDDLVHFIEREAHPLPNATSKPPSSDASAC